MDAEPVPTKPPRKPQLKLITSKQRKYCELRAQGMNQGEAARKAGFSNKTSTYKIDSNPTVRAYLLSIQKNAISRTGYTVAAAMDEAGQDHEFAIKTGNANAAVNATTLRCKLSGHLRDTIEVVSVDLRGALELARTRVIQVNPAYKQLMESSEQASENPTV